MEENKIETLYKIIFTLDKFYFTEENNIPN